MHEYGGGAWSVRGGVLWFADSATQRLHRLGDDGVAVVLTPEPSVPRGCATPTATCRPTARWCCASSEDHAAAGEVQQHDRPPRRRPRRRRRRSSWRARTSCPARAGDPTVAAYCWLEWDHPDMPWDATRLIVDAGGRRTVVAGGPSGSRWSSRRGRPTGRCGSAATAPASGACTAGRPRTASRRWSISAATSASPRGCSASPASPSSTARSVAFVYVEDGLDRLGVRLADGTIVTLDTPFTVIDGLTASGSTLHFIAAVADDGVSRREPRGRRRRRRAIR